MGYGVIFSFVCSACKGTFLQGAAGIQDGGRYAVRWVPAQSRKLSLADSFGNALEELAGRNALLR